MISSRFAISAVVLFQLAVLSCCGYLVLNQSQQQITADQQALSSRVKVIGAQPAQLESLLGLFPVQFARLVSNDASSPWTFGQFRPHQHPLASLLDGQQLQLQVQADEQRLTVGFNADSYLERNTQLLLPLMVGTSIISVLLALSFWFSGRNQRKNLAIMEMSALRLASLDLPAAVNGIHGPFSALASNLKLTKDKLKSQVTQLQKTNASQAKEAMADPLTHLSNRSQFNLDMEQQLTNSGNQGQLLMVRAAALESINNRQGKQAGDSYIATIASHLKQLSQNDHQIRSYRYNGTDFILLLVQKGMEECVATMLPLSKQLEQLAQRCEVDSAGYIGSVSFKQGDRMSQLLLQLDTAISIAQSEGPNRHYQLAPETAELELETDRWQQVVDEVITGNQVDFTCQQVLSMTENKPFYQELLARFSNRDGNPLPTQTLFAMANRHDKAIELDKLLFAQASREIVHRGDPGQSYALNLSSHAVNNVAFLNWLEERIARTPELAGRLVLEISEHAINVNPNQLNHWVKRVHNHGVRIAVEHFGNGLSSFRSLQQLRPDYVKLDPSFSKEIDNNADNRFFVKMLLDIAVRLEIRVIATHIERYEERITMEALRIDGIQGHLVSSPQPMVSTATQKDTSL